MINLADYPFINVCAKMYFCVHNADLWHKKDGYALLNLQHSRNVTDLPDDFLDRVRKTIATTHNVTVDDVEFITEDEYDEAMRNCEQPPINLRFDLDKKGIDVNIGEQFSL